MISRYIPVTAESVIYARERAVEKLHFCSETNKIEQNSNVY